jgi:hypothetical protein
VDQSKSDTCHPCSGDTWHICMDDVARPYGVTCQTVTEQGCADRVDRWMNSNLTRGSYDDMWEGATWPRHGLSHGTHWLA